MAEWRRVYKKMWSDKRFMRLSPNARLMFIALITHADDDGFFEADPESLKASIFPGDQMSVTDTLRYRDEVVTALKSVIHNVDDDEFIELRNFQRHQQTRKDLKKSSDIKRRIDLAGISGQPRNGPVTDPSRDRDVNRVDRVNRVEQLPPPPKSGRHKDRSDTRKPKRTRSKTAVELAFVSGFKNRYGHEIDIDEVNARKLAEKVGRDGRDLVIAKINAWWDSPAGRWADANGSRGVGAFNHSYNDIVVNGYGSSGAKPEPDYSRFANAGKKRVGGAGDVAGVGGGEPPSLLAGVLGDGGDPPAAPGGGAEADEHAA